MLYAGVNTVEHFLALAFDWLLFFGVTIGDAEFLETFGTTPCYIWLRPQTKIMCSDIYSDC